MADLNAIYAPTTDQQDPDYIVAYEPGLFGGHGDPIYLPDELRQQIRANNANAVATAQAVQVPFSGSTSDERTTYVLSIIHAVDNRVEFIKQRVNQLLTSLQANSDDAYNTSLAIFEKGLSLVPGVGAAITYVSNQSSREQEIDLLKVQQLIQSYTSDLTQLAGIRAQFVKEYTGDTSADPTDGAPKVVPAYLWYIGGAFLVILLILIIRNRNRNRR